MSWYAMWVLEHLHPSLWVPSTTYSISSECDGYKMVKLFHVAYGDAVMAYMAVFNTKKLLQLSIVCALSVLTLLDSIQHMSVRNLIAP